MILMHPNARYAQVPLVEPATHGFFLMAIQTGRPTFPVRPIANSDWLRGLKEITAPSFDSGLVTSARLYQAVGRPPLKGLPALPHQVDLLRRAQADVVLLLETPSRTALEIVVESPWLGAIRRWVSKGTRLVHEIPTYVARQVGIDPIPPRSLSLFNFFAAEDDATFLTVWEYLADWYRVEMGLDHAYLLMSDGRPSDYAGVTYATWGGTVAQFIAKQLTKSTFRSYVLANLRAHEVAIMPTLFRPIHAWESKREAYNDPAFNNGNVKGEEKNERI